MYCTFLREVTQKYIWQHWLWSLQFFFCNDNSSPCLKFHQIIQRKVNVVMFHLFNAEEVLDKISLISNIYSKVFHLLREPFIYIDSFCMHLTKPTKTQTHTFHLHPTPFSRFIFLCLLLQRFFQYSRIALFTKWKTTQFHLNYHFQ